MYFAFYCAYIINIYKNRVILLSIIYIVTKYDITFTFYSKQKLNISNKAKNNFIKYSIVSWVYQ